jgi:hypothetical protein
VCRLASSQVQGIRLVHNSRTLSINPSIPVRLLAMEPEAKDPNTSQSLTNDHGTDASQLEESRRDHLVMQIVVRRDLLNVSGYHDSWILSCRGSASFFRHGGSRTLPDFIFAEVRGPSLDYLDAFWTCIFYHRSFLSNLLLLFTLIDRKTAGVMAHSCHRLHTPRSL